MPVIMEDANGQHELSDDEVKELVRGMPDNTNELMDKLMDGFKYLDDVCYDLRGSVIRMNYLSTTVDILNEDEEGVLRYLTRLHAKSKSLLYEVRELVKIMTNVVSTEKTKRR